MMSLRTYTSCWRYGDNRLLVNNFERALPGTETELRNAVRESNGPVAVFHQTIAKIWAYSNDLTEHQV